MYDYEIASQATMLPISKVAERLGVGSYSQYGDYIAKLPHILIDEEKIAKSHLILVTAITPTPAGEGKTTTSIALVDAMNKLGYKAVAALREPSLGPVFGRKGCATGGGRSQINPMIDINLNFTGDFSAIEHAHNLLAAAIDNYIYFNAKHDRQLVAESIRWKRVMDMNDRSLRDIRINNCGRYERSTGFDITAASELMAIVCLSNDVDDLKRRIDNIYVGEFSDGTVCRAKDLNVTGAMLALLKDAVKPNLVQTLENNPVILHGGPFANIAQGTSSLIGTKTAMSLADYVVTEAGFASDLGAEKFFNIKCREGKLKVSAVVLVATVRALKYHGGVGLPDIAEPNIEALVKGCEKNLSRHIGIIRTFGYDPVVVLNRFNTDTVEEIEAVREYCEKSGVLMTVNEAYADGSEGALDFARTVVGSLDKKTPSYTYDLAEGNEEKIRKIVERIYKGRKAVFNGKAAEKIGRIANDGAYVCMAKTQYSLSSDPKDTEYVAGSFDIEINDIEVAAGAKFIIPLVGDMLRMPGLPVIPNAEYIDLIDDKVVGLV